MGAKRGMRLASANQASIKRVLGGFLTLRGNRGLRRTGRIKILLSSRLASDSGCSLKWGDLKHW
jgi:hypothetical protein